MLGTFSGGGLGMGVAFVLEDYFSKTADTIERRMSQLGGYTDAMSAKIDRAMNRIKMGVAAAAIGAAILVPFVRGIKHASDLEENINKVDVAFGKYSENIKKFSETSLDRFGIDKIAALDMAALFGDMGTGMGIAQKDAQEMSQSLVSLAGDLASFKNLSHSQVQTALKGIFTGETESLKNLGIVMTQTELQAYAMSRGIAKEYKDMTQAEKVMLRFEFVTARSKNAIGDFIRTADGFANSKRVFEGSIKEMSATMGNILMPIASKLLQVFSKIVKTLTAFGKTNAGKTVLSLVAALGAFLVVGGLALILMGGMRFSLYKLTGAFGATTKAQLIATIATKGFSAGLRAMGAAMWAATGPFIIVIAAIAALIAIGNKAWKMMDTGSETTARWGVILMSLLGPIGWVLTYIVGIRRGFRELAEWDGKSAKGGILGFFMRIAAVIKAAGQIWASFNGETFSLTKELRDKLEALGLLDFVITLGRWISRIKTIWMGVVDGFRAGFQILSDRFAALRERLSGSFERMWTSFSNMIHRLKEIFQPIIDIFHRITGGIFENMGSLITWKNIAEFIGASIAFTFETVAWVLETVITAIVTAMEFFASMGEAIVNGFGFVVDYVSGLFDVGVSFVTNIWDGIKSVWGSMATWVSDKLTGLFDKIKAPFKWIGDKLGQAYDFVTGNDETDPNNGDIPSGNGAGDVPSLGGMHHANTSKNPVVINNNKTSTNNKSEQPIILQNILDGEVISENVINRMEMADARG